MADKRMIASCRYNVYISTGSIKYPCLEANQGGSRGMLPRVFLFEKKVHSGDFEGKLGKL